MINAASHYKLSTLMDVLIGYYRNKTDHSALFLTHDYLEGGTSIAQYKYNLNPRTLHNHDKILR